VHREQVDIDLGGLERTGQFDSAEHLDLSPECCTQYQEAMEELLDRIVFACIEVSPSTPAALSL